MSNKRQIVLGITGASGAIYAERYIRGCAQMRNISLSVIFTETARNIWLRELGYDPEKLISECSASILPNDNFDAPFCSGSAVADTMLVLPCSMGALARIAGGLPQMPSLGYGRTAQRKETTYNSASRNSHQPDTPPKYETADAGRCSDMPRLAFFL